jgi:hypothetical protein
MREITYEITENVTPGTAEFDPIVMILSFHSVADMRAWKQGQAFRLIIHWIKPAPIPRGK